MHSKIDRKEIVLNYTGIMKNAGRTVDYNNAYEFAKLNTVNSYTDLKKFAEWFFIYADIQTKNDFTDWYFSGDWVRCGNTHKV